MRQQPELVHEMNLRPPADLLAWSFRIAGTAGWSSLPWLHRLTHETLVVHGDDDPIVPVLNGRVVACLIPEARLHVVRGGGHLLLGPRSGMKDEFNRLNLERQPGPLADLLGGRVEQFYALDESIAVGKDGKANIWAEDLATRAPDTEVLLRYGKANGWLDGHPAAISRRVGKGRITYLGALVDAPTMAGLIDRALADSGLAREFDPPEDVEMLRRTGEGREVLIVINHGRETRAVALPAAMTDVLAGGTKTSLNLAPEGVAVLTRPEGARP
jgi:beta-galactosidase